MRTTSMSGIAALAIALAACGGAEEGGEPSRESTTTFGLRAEAENDPRCVEVVTITDDPMLEGARAPNPLCEQVERAGAIQCDPDPVTCEEVERDGGLLRFRCALPGIPECRSETVVMRGGGSAQAELAIECDGVEQFRCSYDGE